jgi:hypothetical protein
VFDRGGSADQATGRRRLAILLSNLGSVRRLVDLPNNIGGFSVFKPPGAETLDRFDDFSIDPGQHRVLNFALQMSSRGQVEWVFTGGSVLVTDNNRNGIGGVAVAPAVRAFVSSASAQILAAKAGWRAADLWRDITDEPSEVTA